MEVLILKVLGIGFLVFIVVPVFKFWIVAKAKQRIWEQQRQQKQGKKGGSDNIRREVDLKQYQAIKEIYKREREPLYLLNRDLFKDLMKVGKLTREDIFQFRYLLEDCLGEYVHDFDNYEHKVKVKDKSGNEKEVVKKGFDNECHRIYVYLKSYSLTPSNWQKINQFLVSCQNSTKEEII
jgi:hypothetical protein